MPVSIVNSALGDFMSTLGHKWKWFVGIGALLIILGMLALGNQLMATVFSIYYIGALMLISGVLEIIHAFKVRGVGLSLYWGGAGLLYAIAGLIAFSNPILASSVLTLLMAVALIVMGIIRIGHGIRTRQYVGSGWIIFSGLMTLFLGVLIAVGWPVNSLWILGIFLGIDLLFQGWGYVTFGLAIRASTKK